MNNLVIQETLKRLLAEDPYFDELAIFDFLDIDKKGYLEINDILAFIKSHNENIHILKAEKIFARFDEDHDDRVYFEEFVFGIRPMLSYKFENPGRQRRSISPAMYYHEENIQPLRKKYNPKKTKISRTEFKHKENKRSFKNTSPTRVSPAREGGYNSMGNVNPIALFPTNNSDKLWYNKNPINFRGYYDWELLKKSYGLSNERSKQVEHMLCRHELEASKYMSPDRAKNIKNKLENSSGFIKTTFSPQEFKKLELCQDKYSKTSPNTSAKKANNEEFVTTLSNHEKKDNTINENTADTRMAKVQKKKKNSLTEELESRYQTELKNFWNSSNSKNTRSNNRSIGYTELTKALNLEQETQIINEDEVDNTERAKNEEIHLNNSEFIIIDKAQYSNDQKQIDVIQEADYQEEVLVDDSFSKKKDNQLTDINYVS